MPIPDGFVLDSTASSAIHVNDADVVATLNLVAPQSLAPETGYQITFDLQNNRATPADVMYQVVVNGNVVKESDVSTIDAGAVASQTVQLDGFTKADRGTDAKLDVNTYRKA